MQAFRGPWRLVATAEKEASMSSSLLCRCGASYLSGQTPSLPGLDELQRDNCAHLVIGCMHTGYLSTGKCCKEFIIANGEGTMVSSTHGASSFGRCKRFCRTICRSHPYLKEGLLKNLVPQGNAATHDPLAHALPAIRQGRGSFRRGGSCCKWRGRRVAVLIK